MSLSNLESEDTNSTSSPEPDEDIAPEGCTWNDWGYVIYRTTFAPGTDAQWAKAVKKLSHYIYRPCPGDRWHGFGWIQINDPKNAGASLDDIRTQFRQWVKDLGRDVAEVGCPMYSVCLVVDDDVLDDILAAPKPSKAGLGTYSVKVVDPGFDPAREAGKRMHPRRCEADYGGWMRCGLTHLYWLQVMLFSHSIESLSPPFVNGDCEPWTEV